MTTTPPDDYEQWAPVSDILAVLMLVFMLMAVIFVSQEGLSLTECSQMAAELSNAFDGELGGWVLGNNNLTARVGPAGETFFQHENDALTKEAKSSLDEFFPGFLRAVRRLEDKYGNEPRYRFRGIRIEGHASSDGPADTNVEYSQGRARNVYEYVRDLFDEGSEQREWIDRNFFVAGFSELRLVDEHGELVEGSGLPENPARSRRVEFRVLTEVCEHADWLQRRAGFAGPPFGNSGERQR